MIRGFKGVFAPLARATAEQLSTAANAALRGETFNTGRLEEPGEQEYTLIDPRLGIGKVLLLVPLNYDAAQLHWYITEVRNGEADIVFNSTPAGSLFNYVIIGHGKS